MAFDQRERTYVDAVAHPEAVEQEGLLVLAAQGPLFFGDASPIRAQVVQMAHESRAATVVLDLGTVPGIDVDGADMLAKLAAQLAARGVRLLLARVDAQAFELLRRAGALDALGAQHVFPTVRAAVRGRTALEETRSTGE